MLRYLLHSRITFERADLYERTTALSRRLFDLHRLGAELSTHKELASLLRAFATNVERLVAASAVAIYLDAGDNVEFAVTTGTAPTDVRTLPKSSPTPRSSPIGAATAFISGIAKAI